MTSDRIGCLRGRVAIVTGGSSGIGAAIAQRFLLEGAQVVITARHDPVIDEGLAPYEGSIATVTANAGAPDQSRAVVEAALQRFGRVDILVNNAATSPYFGRLIDIDLPRFDKTIEVNLRGSLVLMQEAWSQWMSTNGGVIINIASNGGYQYGGNLGMYDLTKSGLIFLTKHMATELGPRVRVNAIAPGIVKTAFSRALWEDHPEGEAWGWPLGRLGTPEDVAEAATFLAGDSATWITGHVLVVDGGALLG